MALKDGIPASVVRDELLALERRKMELAARREVSVAPLGSPAEGVLTMP
jgi:hypothetical protein